MAFAVLPLAGAAQAQDNDAACPDDVSAAPFTDRDSISTAHRANVDCAFHNNIVSGFEDNTYRPRLQVRRDQMATFIAGTLDAAGVELPAPDPDRFTDVPTTNVHSDAIHRLKAAGIVEGGPAALTPDQYGPALRTRRDQMASFLIRAAEFALDQDLGSTTPRFDDVPPGNVHFANVNAAFETGLALGITAEQFGPSNPTLRDQMASFVVRLLGFLLTDVDGPVLDVALDPADCAVGAELTATATLSIEGAPIEGEDVDFTTSGVATTPDEGTAETDADGEADFTFTVDAAGTLTVTATWTSNGQEATGTAQATCEIAEDTGVIIDFDTAADTYTYVPDGGDDTVTVTYDPDDDTFQVDGTAATVAVFEADISIGDRITVTTNGVTDHALVNVDPPDEGVIGNINTGTPPFPQTYAVIEPVSGVQLSGFISYVTTCDVYEVDGAAVPLVIFESHLSEGDVLERQEVAGQEVCGLTNQTVSGTVQDVVTDPFPAALFKIGNLGDSYDDSDAATGPLSTFDSEFLVDPGYNQDFTVDGVAATRAEFVDALSDGDQASYTREAGLETFNLVNAAPGTLSGVATEDFTPGGAADGGTFELLPAGATTRETVTYTAAATFIVDGLVATEAEFETAYSPGDDVSYTPEDVPTGTDEVLSLNSQELTGIPEDIDTTGNTYDVENAAGGVIYDNLDYTAAIFGGVDRYFVDGSEVATAAFETALDDDCAAPATNPCTIRVVDTLLATEHRLTTS